MLAQLVLGSRFMIFNWVDKLELEWDAKINKKEIICMMSDVCFLFFRVLYPNSDVFYILSIAHLLRRALEAFIPNRQLLILHVVDPTTGGRPISHEIKLISPRIVP